MRTKSAPRPCRAGAGAALAPGVRPAGPRACGRASGRRRPLRLRPLRPDDGASAARPGPPPWRWVLRVNGDLRRMSEAPQYANRPPGAKADRRDDLSRFSRIPGTKWLCARFLGVIPFDEGGNPWVAEFCFGFSACRSPSSFLSRCSTTERSRAAKSTKRDVICEPGGETDDDGFCVGVWTSVSEAPLKPSSSVSWPAIIAGAVVASAFSLALVAVGAGLGLISISPWSGNNPSVATFGVLAAAWLIAMQLFASGVGGYLAGRLRARWVGDNRDEVYFRDTAHGLLVWALGAVISAALFVFVAGRRSSAAPPAPARRPCKRPASPSPFPPPDSPVSRQPKPAG